MFRGIPTILTADEVLDKAFRRGSRVHGRGNTAVERARSSGLAHLHAVQDVIVDTLGGYVKAFPAVEALPPLYRELVDIMVGGDDLRHHLGTIDWATDQVRRLLGGPRRTVARARGGREVAGVIRGAYGRVASVLHQVGPSLEFLGKARDALRRLPDIDAGLPTIVVAGAPNVGKSQLVRALSTATPRVASYPFTTKRISVGHFDHEGRTFQVIDTPGLLDRPEAERNAVERQAAAALRHVAHVILFLTDPTETCGFPWDYQMAILDGLRGALPGVPLVVVQNKADLGSPRVEGPRVSALTGKGVEKLRTLLVREATSRAPAVAPPWEG